MSVAKAKLHIRPATIEDAAQLYLWDEKPHVQAAVSNSGTSSFDADWEEELAQRSDGTEFFIAQVATVAIGALQIIDPATERSHYWGEMAENQKAIDIWIGEESYLGQGYGTQMMAFAIEHCFATEKVHTILIDPLSNNLRAHKFYQSIGFEFVEQRQFDEESDCTVFKLTRKKYLSLR